MLQPQSRGMSRLQAIEEVVGLVVTWSQILAVVLVLLAVWVVVNGPNRRLRNQCCRRSHPSLTHERWMSEGNIPLQYATPLAFQVYGVRWLTTNWRARNARRNPSWLITDFAPRWGDASPRRGITAGSSARHRRSRPARWRASWSTLLSWCRTTASSARQLSIRWRTPTSSSSPPPDPQTMPTILPRTTVDST